MFKKIENHKTIIVLLLIIIAVLLGGLRNINKDLDFYKGRSDLDREEAQKLRTEITSLTEDLEKNKNELNRLNIKYIESKELLENLEIKVVEKEIKIRSLEDKLTNSSDKSSKQEDNIKEEELNTDVKTTNRSSNKITEEVKPEKEVKEDIVIPKNKTIKQFTGTLSSQGRFLNTRSNKLNSLYASNESFIISEIKQGDESFHTIQTMDGDYFTAIDDMFIETLKWKNLETQKFDINFLSDSIISVQLGDKFLQINNGESYLSNSSGTFKLKEIISKKGNFDYLAQLDPKWKEKPYSWKDLGAAGCGIFSATMIIDHAVSEDVEFLDIYEITRENNLDIQESPRTDMPALLNILKDKYNFHYKSITTSDIVNELKSGNEVLIASWPNDLINYHGRGHYFVLRGLTEDNKLIVVEPYYKGGDDYHAFDEQLEEKYILDPEEFSFKTEPWKMYNKAFEVYSIWSK